jgi:hypothetical protein
MIDERKMFLLIFYSFLEWIRPAGNNPSRRHFCTGKKKGVTANA